VDMVEGTAPGLANAELPAYVPADVAMGVKPAVT